MFDIPFYNKNNDWGGEPMHHKQNNVLSTSNIIDDFVFISKIGILSIPALIAAPFPGRIRNSALNMLINHSGHSTKKLGQWISSRKDIFPVGICESLSFLRDSARQHAFRETLLVMKEDGFEIEKRKDGIFMVGARNLSGKVILDSKITPIGSGTVAQVYKCKLNGDAVVLKVLHPGIRKKLEKELSTVSKIVNLMSKFKIFNHYDLNAQFKEFQNQFLLQCDLQNEMTNLGLLKRINPSIRIPSPILSTKNILLEEWIECREIDTNVDNKRELSKKCLQFVSKMLLKDQFVHSDLHAGNVKITPKGDLVLLDGGLCKYFTKNEKKNFYDLIYELFYMKDGRAAAELLILRSEKNKSCDASQFSNDFSLLCNKYLFDKITAPQHLMKLPFFREVSGTRIRLRHFRQAFYEFHKLLSERRVILDSSYSHVLTSLLCFDGTVRFLYEYLNSWDYRLSVLKNIPLPVLVTKELRNNVLKLFRRYN